MVSDTETDRILLIIPFEWKLNPITKAEAEKDTVYPFLYVSLALGYLMNCSDAASATENNEVKWRRCGDYFDSFIIIFPQSFSLTY